MNFRKILLASFAVTGAASALGGQAAAQSTESAGPSTVGDIVVTAQKRDQNLQDVPVSVSAYTAEFRETTGIITAQDQTNFAPGVSYNTTADRVTIRGIGRVTNQLGSDPGVAVYQDGFYVNSLGGVGGSTLFQERTEILRGPQGTLYGRNSIGGAINVISRRPGDELEGEMRAGLTDYGRVTLQTRVAGPLSDNVRASFGAYTINQNEGWYHNVSGGPDEGGVVDQWGAELQLSFDIGTDFEGWMKYATAGADNNDRTGTLVSGYDTSYALNIPTPTYGLDPLSNPGINDPRAFDANRQGEQWVEDYHLFTTELIYHWDTVDLKYIGGYLNQVAGYDVDADGTSRVGFQYPRNCSPTALLDLLAGILDNPNFDCNSAVPGVQPLFVDVLGDITSGADSHKIAWSHEFNLSSTGDGPLQWLLGAYYYQEDEWQQFYIGVPGQPEMLGPFGLGGAATLRENPLYDGYRYRANLDTRSAAVFGQLDYDFTDDWHVTFGLRYNHDEKDGYEWNIIPAWFALGFATPGGGIPFDVIIDTCNSDAEGSNPADPGFDCPVERRPENTFNATTGTLGLQWTPTDDTLVYASYSRGFKSGGFNLGTFGENPNVGEETVDAFEIGWKQAFGPRFQFNAAAFFYQYHDLQVLDQEFPTANVSVPVFVNVDESESLGFEIETLWAMTDNLQVLFNYGYLDNEVTEGCCFLDAADPRSENAPGQSTGVNVGTVGEPRFEQTLVGNTLPGSPEHKAALNVIYTIPFSNGSALSLSGTANYKSETYSAVFNTADYLQDEFTTLDLRAVWRSADERFSVIGSVINATDEEAVQNFTTTSEETSNQQTLGLQPPRIYAVEFQYRF